MTHQEIDALALTGNATLIAVLNSMNLAFELNDAFNENWYLRFTPVEGQEKPTQQAVETAFTSYKTVLHATETERERVADINTRWAAIADIRAAIAEAGLSITNPDLELARIITQNDQDRLEAIEQGWTDYQPKKARQDGIEANIAIGENDEKCCQDVRKYINGVNRNRNFTAEQVTLMVTTFGTIQSLLIGLRPSSALKLVNAITPDGEVVTAEIKENTQWIFAKYGIEPAP